MKQTFLLERVLGQTRLAVIEEGNLCELYYERPGQEKLSGNIYVGRVENVLPGMNAAFVDIGMDKNAFLYAGDIQIDTRHEQGLADRLKNARIEKMVRPGQQIIVQVIKEPGGTKGPRISSYATLPGRLMVLLPGMRYVGVSRKISDENERKCLYEVGHSLLSEADAGVILRTASEGASKEAITTEYRNLLNLWNGIRTRGEHSVKPKLIHSDGSLVLRAVRDMLNEETDAIITDDKQLFDELRSYAEMLAPEWIEKIRIHKSQMPLFDLHKVDHQADKTYSRHVWLKSGGSLVIEETEALTVIDVNTGKFVGKKSLGETIFKINCEAAEEIMRQIRLRDLGGIIIIDFIDMENNVQKEALVELLRELAVRDRNHTNIAGITSLGLVEMTRKKVRQPMSKQLMHICSACGGNGIVPSFETTARKIAREIWRKQRMGETSPLLVEAAETVCGWLKTIGAPEDMQVYICPAYDIKDGEYRISPADISALPNNTKLLK